MEAHLLDDVDRMYQAKMAAWDHQMVKATKKNGKPVYDKFAKFFDYEKAVRDTRIQYESGYNDTRRAASRLGKQLDERYQSYVEGREVN